jgi:DNA modification methylase
MINSVIQGNCLEVMKTMEENSVDSIVTDPPYELGFMGKSWDNTGIAYNVEMWKEALRVLKPGGHLLSFGGTRTYHRMACAIEDAGFEVRDMVSWIYGSGFPKSLNIGKAVDKRKGYKEFGNDFVHKLQDFINDGRKAKGLTYKDLNGLFGFPENSGMAGHWCGDRTQPIIPRLQYWEKLKNKLNLSDEFDNFIVEVEREVVGKGEAGFLERNSVFKLNKVGYGSFDLTKGTSEWEGWGTALKPACEPCVLARKPLSEKTVALNVLKWGTGGINIDGSRIPANRKEERPESWFNSGTSKSGEVTYGGNLKTLTETTVGERLNDGGRFPANLIHDGSDEVLEVFPNTKSGKIKPYTENPQSPSSFNFAGGEKPAFDYGDSGSASRFFYCAKTSKSERNKGCEGLPDASYKMHRPPDSDPDLVPMINKNNHPTVKPQALMKYLITLITPKGGTVLDPFAGSGSTLVAAKDLGFNYIGIELTPEYIPIIQARLK